MVKSPCNSEAARPCGNGVLPQKSPGAANPVTKHEMNDAPRAIPPTPCPSPSLFALGTGRYVTPSVTNYNEATANPSIVDPLPKLDDLEAFGQPSRQLNIDTRHNQNHPCKTAMDTPWAPNSYDNGKSVLTLSSETPEAADIFAGGLLGRNVSDALSLHQSFVHPSLNIIPCDSEFLQRHGPEKYTLALIVEMETKLGMTRQGRGNRLEERIRYLKESRPSKDHESLLRPTREPYTCTDTWTLVCELQHYPLLQTDYLSWPEKDFDVHARIFACRGFGILRSETPPHMNLPDILRTLAANFDIYNDIPNDLATGLNQNALLACGLLHCLSPTKLSIEWDALFLGNYGSRCYADYILGCLGTIIEGQPILSFHQDELFDKLVRDQLKEYNTLEAEFSSRPTPEGMTTLRALALIQRFPEGPSSFVVWQGPAFGEALAFFITKCLAALGLTASLEAIQQDVIRVLMNINWKLEKKWSCPVSKLLENCGEQLGGRCSAYDDDESNAEDEPSTDDNFNSTAHDDSRKTFGKLDTSSLDGPHPYELPRLEGSGVSTKQPPQQPPQELDIQSWLRAII